MRKIARKIVTRKASESIVDPIETGIVCRAQVKASVLSKIERAIRAGQISSVREKDSVSRNLRKTTEAKRPPKI